MFKRLASVVSPVVRRVGNLARSKKVVSALALAATAGVASAQGYVSPLPTDLQPTAMITVVMNEAKIWLVLAIPALLALALLAKFIHGLRNGAGRVISH